MNQRITSNGLWRAVNFVRHRLPDANVACRDGAITLSTWVQEVRSVLDGTASAASRLGPSGRLLLLQHLGMVLASGERHAQAQGHKPGWILRQLAGLEEALATAASGERVPALTSELYWERNTTHPPLSFTGEQHEFFFISSVRAQTALRAIVNRQLRALLDGVWNPAKPEGARMLRAAAAAMREEHGQYLDFRRGPEGQPLMTPKQFNEMRAWLASTVIHGEALAGANAEYIPEMVVTDFLLGTADAGYEEYVGSFDRYHSLEGRDLISRDRSRPSLVTLLVEALGFNVQEFDEASPAAIAERVRSAPTAFGWTLKAFKDLTEEFIGSSGTQVGLIHVYLEKYGNDLSPAELEKMPLKPAHGTGGNSHGQIRQIHDMRRKSVRIRKFISALRAAALASSARRNVP